MTKNKQKQEAFIDTSLHSLLLVSSSKTFWHFVPYIVLKPGCFPELKYVSHVIASGKWKGRNLLWKICIVPVEQEHRTQSCSRCLKLMSISLCHIFIQQPNQCVTITVMKWHLASEILDITWLKHLFVWGFFWPQFNHSDTQWIFPVHHTYSTLGNKNALSVGSMPGLYLSEFLHKNPPKLVEVLLCHMGFSHLPFI